MPAEHNGDRRSPAAADPYRAKTDLDVRAVDYRIRFGVALLLGLFSAVLYATTWSGKYFHDGPIFIQGFEAGQVAFVHMGYLPVAHGLHFVLDLFFDCSPESALAVLAVSSGALLVSLSFLLAERLTRDVVVAAGVAVLVALAPAVWFGACHVEVHLFGGLVACLAAWIVLAAPLPPAWRSALGCGLAPLGHMSNVLMAPFLLFLAMHEERNRTGRMPSPRTVVASAVSGAAGVLAVVFVAGWMPPKNTKLALFSWSDLASMVQRTVGDFDVVSGRLFEEAVRPWMLLVLAPLLVLALHPRRARLVVAIGASSSLLLFWVCAFVMFRHYGQYGLILVPALAGLSALALASIAATRIRTVLLLALIVTQAFLARPEFVRVAQDPDQQWARSVATRIEGRGSVIVFGEVRRFGLERALDARGRGAIRIENFVRLVDRPQEDASTLVLEVAQKHLDAGESLYLDPRLFTIGRQFRRLVPYVVALENHLLLESLPGTQLLRLTAIDDPSLEFGEQLVLDGR